MKSFLKLIRWQNLIIVALTMILMRYAVINVLLGEIGVIMIHGETAMEVKFPLINFILLVAATVFITAGGYVINDYFDIKADTVNKGKISRSQVMTLHNVLNLTGVALGFYISWRSGYTLLGVIFLMVSGLLYFYSTSYKRQFLIGNIIVAFLTAMVPMLVAIYEWSAVYRFYAINTARMPDLNFIFYWLGGFALFAFITTLTREIIKDIEDYEGDESYGRDTVPIILGIITSKIIVITLIVITITMLYAVWYLFLFDKYTLIYISAFIVVPLIYVTIMIFRNVSVRQFHKASRLMKAIMLAGILYSLIVKALINWNLV